jgi:hypothetical protein
MVTDTYLHSNQEDVLKKVADAHRGPGEAKEKCLPQKRAAKATKKFDARAALRAQKEAPEKIGQNESTAVLHSVQPPGAHERHLRRFERTKRNR